MLAVAALGLGGCAGHSDFMTKVPEATAPLAAPPNSATDKGRGAAFKMWLNTSTKLSPPNGASLVSSRYMTTPKDQMSLRESTRCGVVICSGDM